MKFKRRRRYDRSSVIPQLMIILVPILVLVAIYTLFRTTPEMKAEEVVATFYKYEQNNDFASSWELFHPQMQNIFTKSNYVQYRNQIFVDQLGAKTFDYTVGNAKLLTNWKMTEESEPLLDVYEVSVTQEYQGIFGNFSVQQRVYVAKDEEEWRVLWSYE
ncbi:hypothetical protein IM538_22140 [Cytobacillus suaedae]|nr:hypothetical protein IM538_22140 [Cytobacillus suaedae]